MPTEKSCPWAWSAAPWRRIHKEPDSRNAIRQHGDAGLTTSSGGKPPHSKSRVTSRSGLFPGCRGTSCYNSALVLDFVYALRGLRKNPGFTGVAVLTLALGIGANTAIFAVLDPLLLRKLPVVHPDELVLLGSAGSLETLHSAELSTFKTYRDHNQVFSGVIAFDSIAEAAFLRDGSAVPVRGAVVSGNYFTLLGVRPHLGRLLVTDDDRGPAGSPLLVLSYDCWQREFASDSQIAGKTVSLDNRTYTIVGVTPAPFVGTVIGESPDFYIPLSQRNPGWVTIMARLNPGVTLAQAQAGMEPLFRETVRQSRVPPVEIEQAMARLILTPAARGVDESTERFALPARILAGVVVLVLLIACSNVANLLLARGIARSREITVRLAMGAGRWRLIRLLLIESALLATMGAAAGVVAGRWAGALLADALSTEQTPVVLAASGANRMLIFTIVVLGASVLLCGLAPALAATRVDLAAGLKIQNAGLSGQSWRSRLSKVLVVTQVALSAMLLAGAGLLLRSLVNLQTLDTGFHRHSILLVSLRASPARPRTQGPAFYAELVERAKHLPGVRAASLSTSTPMGYKHYGINVAIEGEPQRPSDQSHIFFTSVMPGYFETMGIPLLAGRDFTPHDASASVVIINRAMARQYFGEQNPIGKRFRFVEGNRPPMEIIGIAADSKYHDLREQAYPYCYVPRSAGYSGGTLEVRATGNAAKLAGPLRELVHSLDRSEAVTSIRTLGEQVDESILAERTITALCGAFAALALALASVGLYGTLASSVARRTSEIGVRMALGARAPDVIRMIVAEGLALVSAGIALGVAGGIVLTGAASTLLFGVAPSDPWTYATVTAILAASAGAAAYIPARRASKLDPMIALRCE